MSAIRASLACPSPRDLRRTAMFSPGAGVLSMNLLFHAEAATYRQIPCGSNLLCVICVN